MAIGFAFTYRKMPNILKRFIRKHYLITDLILSWGCLKIMGFAMVGIMTAAFLDIMVGIWLWYEHQHQHEVAT